MVRIIRIEVSDDYHIHFVFSDGCEKLVDFRPFIKSGTLTEPLKESEFFNRVKIYDNGRGIYWPNNYDVCPDNLRYYVKAESLPMKEQQAAQM
jgi:hypothetical protein